MSKVPMMLLGARRFIPVLVRHLGNYLDLFEAELGVARMAVRRRLLLVAIAAISTVTSVGLITFGIVVAFWDTPYRLWVIGGLAAAFAITAAAAVALAAREPARMFARLRAEWAQDRMLLPGMRRPITQGEVDGPGLAG